MTPKCPDCNHDQDDCICIDSFSVGAASRDSEVANLKQQVSHMVDMVACEKSNAEYFKRQRDDLLAALEQFATWGRMQHKSQSKGCHSTFDMMLLRDEIELAEAAIASVKANTK